MTTRLPNLTDTTPRGITVWASSICRIVEGVLNRLSTDVQLGRVRSYTVAELPDVAGPTRLIFVMDEIGGATMAFNDGTFWRRVQDRVVVS
jgi:hypothetical protein